MPIFKNMVTCVYCEHHMFAYNEKEDLSIHCNGYCNVKKGVMPIYGEICVGFEKKAGLYTSKWYPDKK